jgi:alpha-beta hydrolase superfamily lysophospholipase
MTAPRAEPVYFGPDDRPLFGWIHRPQRAARYSLGLVLCNPFGYEAICAHRALRHFAEAAADAGIPALRFDYDGTGDSAGTDLDPDRLSAWIASVHAAAETLRGEAGCDRVCFLGVRLGATLAALAASERSDVAGLIALAPVISGKAYTRELRALQMASGIGLPETADSALMEVTGFALGAATRTSLAAVDLSKLERAPASQVLILDRHDLPGNERWAAHLQASGATVERHAVPGYAEMMLSPHATMVPSEMLRLTVTWLCDRGAAEPLAQRDRFSRDTVPRSRRAIRLPPGAPGGVPISETSAFLDSGRVLFGILTAPHPAATDTADAAGAKELRTGILLLNAGGTHHIGSNRLYVTLARRWASQGHVVLRMDISGVGDSLPRPGETENAIYTARAAEDIREAMHYLRERAGVSECRALGLCSGAYHAFKAAVGGAPLQAVVMINPLTFFWKEGMSLDAPLTDQEVISEAHRYRGTAFRLHSWRKLMRGEVDVGKVAQIMSRRTSAWLSRHWRDLARNLGVPLTDDLGHELESVAERGTAMLFVFATNDPGLQLLRTQGGSRVRKLRARGQLAIQLINGADHTFTAGSARERLITVLSEALDQVRGHV